MDSLKAFALGEANRHKPLMIFDWIKAAKLIKENKPIKVEAGLSGDWEWTGGIIYEDGKIVKNSYTYLASTWATPLIEIDGDTIPCYVMETKDVKWNSDTKWPKEALDILGDANE